MGKRDTELTVVPAELYGIRVLVRRRPDAKQGNLELVAYLPAGNGKTKPRRTSAQTRDSLEAGTRAHQWAKELARELGIGSGERMTGRFNAGGDITDMDALDYYEEYVLPSLKGEYAKYARARIAVLRATLPMVAEEGVETPLRHWQQSVVKKYTDVRMDLGGLAKNGSGEFTGEPISETTVGKDLEFLSRAINAARSYETVDEHGRKVHPLQYNPFEDPSKRIRLPESTAMTQQPVMDNEVHEALLEVADLFDERANAEYVRLKYKRYPHYTPRCPRYTRSLLEVARQGRRRQAIAALVWNDVYFPGDKRMPAAVSKALGNVRLKPEDVFSFFPYGMLLYRKDSDKTSLERIAPMPRYLCEGLLAFRETHPHKKRPSGPLFYRIRDGNEQTSAGNLAQWFPMIQKLAGLEHYRQEGWHMWRRLFRQERQGHISNKIVAYCGGWMKLPSLNSLLDVDDAQPMNRHYLQVLLTQMYACMAFDAKAAQAVRPIPGISDEVLAQLRAEAYEPATTAY